MGNGAVAYLDLKDDAGEVIDRFFERVSHAALTDVAVDWNGMQISEIYPQRIPDLFVGRPVVVTGRFSGAAPSEIRIRGRTGGRACELIARGDGESGAGH